VRLDVFGAFGLEWFDVVVPHFVLHILIVNFSWIVSASGCRHILPNHLNLGVFVAVLFFYILHFSISLLILEFRICHNNCSGNSHWTCTEIWNCD
jgi:hypothetical protein